MTEILFLAHRIPYPPDRGDKIRSWHMLRHLATLGRVHLACLADDEADAQHLGALREAMGGRLGDAKVAVRRGRSKAALRAILGGKAISLPLFESADLHAFVREILSRPEVRTVFASSAQTAQYVPQRVAQRFVMDFIDVDSAKFDDYARAEPWPLRRIYAREARKLRQFERATAARADVSLFVSDAEAELFRRRTGLAHADIRTLQNGIDLDFYDPEAAFPRFGEQELGEGPLVVFTGQMDYAPNIEAVKAFAEGAMPLIRARRPDVRFAIVGRNPPAAVMSLASLPEIIVTGAVADVRPWLAAADIVVAPLKIARGVQNKLLEAMAMARPAVASTAAWTGIDAEPGQHLLIADSPAEQADSVLRLLASPVAAVRMGAAARQRMASAYRWDMRLAPLTQIVALPSAQAAA